MKSFAVGIDGGGSKTEALLLDLESGESISVFAGGINSIVDGNDTTQANLRELLYRIKACLSEREGDLLSICIGSASIIREPQGYWAMRLLSEAFPTAKLTGLGDCRIALEGALGGGPGLIVVAGTGSMAYAIGPDGTIRQCGGFGPLFGDEGSGYDIGREALRAVAMQLDGRGEGTLLTETLQAAIGFVTEEDLIDRTYGDFSRKDIAALTEYVGACALQGDFVARRILQEAAKHLSELLLSLIDRIAWNERPLMSYAGGVFQMGSLILDPLREHLGNWATQLRHPLGSPANGAAMLAVKEMG
ncbi:N-acetylglucosamine kinase [Paenibacillus solisilvae]|uniref:N-acetylglucosamine kinase n=1 Tax=Paenibacillus solisilvae TaxID=2486751 RepID=A0ABW0W281_9BACL